MNRESTRDKRQKDKKRKESGGRTESGEENEEFLPVKSMCASNC